SDAIAPLPRALRPSHSRGASSACLVRGRQHTDFARASRASAGERVDESSRGVRARATRTRQQERCVALRTRQPPWTAILRNCCVLAHSTVVLLAPVVLCRLALCQERVPGAATSAAPLARHLFGRSNHREYQLAAFGNVGLAKDVDQVIAHGVR